MEANAVTAEEPEMFCPTQPMLKAELLAELIVQHAKRNELHAIETLIKARDQIWIDNANEAARSPPERS